MPAILYKNKRFTPLSLAVKNLKMSLDEGGTQRGCRMKKVYT